MRAIPPGSLVLSNLDEMNPSMLVRNGQLKTVRLIPEVGAPPFFAILER